MSAMATFEETRGGTGCSAAGAKVDFHPHLFRFGLRKFFLFVTGVALLLGAMAAIGGGWAVGLAFLASLVVAHVLATFVGTRLRDASPTARRWRAGEAAQWPLRGTLSAAQMAAIPETTLAKHEHAPGRSIAASIAGGAMGGALGLWGISAIAGSEVTVAGVALGVMSCGVVGAWMALLAAHFLSVSRRAWRAANGEPGTPPARQRRRFWGGLR